jgi:hypothetical protein
MGVRMRIGSETGSVEWIVECGVDCETGIGGVRLGVWCGVCSMDSKVYKHGVREGWGERHIWMLVRWWFTAY